MLATGAKLAERFRIEEQLGRGTVGERYRAWDEVGSRHVVLQALPEALGREPYYAERLERRAELLARLRHPNIVPLLGVAREGDTLLFVSGEGEGRPLHMRLAQSGGRLPAEEVAAIGDQVCAALQYGHARGVVHGALGMATIALGDGGSVQLSEYAVALTVQPEAQPEPSADLYRLGATLYEALAGYPSLSNTDARTATTPLESILLRCVADDPRERYNSPEELAQALRSTLPAGEPLGAERPGPAIEATPGLQPLAETGPAVAPVRTAVRRVPLSRSHWLWVLALALLPLAAVGIALYRVAAARQPQVLDTRSLTRIDQPDDPTLLRLTDALTLELQRVPAGEFVMGTPDSNKDADRDEMPQHTVALDGFYIARYEVTTAQWTAFVRATGWEGSLASLDNPDDHPVNYVHWGDAAAFCAWASAVTGRNVHLPTEAQWEKAARGTDAREYPWGEAAPTCDLCNCYHERACVDETSRVGAYPLGDSPYGCADMAGNVWEWVQDWYSPGYYALAEPVNPSGPAHGLYRVLRGGGWMSNEWRMRTARRFRGDPTFRCVDLGFRVAVSDERATRTAGSRPAA
ncbi:MAG: SUMF1/EgtB/PvdO family nonheme iron enzyme [Chloroflexi bacterium]|nr:SUMF1/EgtB/PvdO family nonheme iron enzyme [Chloroflexota bacterium]